MKNTEGMLAARKKQAEDKERYVLSVIRDMRKNGESVTFYSLQKKTGCSKSYLYGNEKIAEAVRNGGPAKRSPDSMEMLLKAEKEKNSQLEKQIRELQKYKDRYEKLRQENQELKHQLSAAYEYEEVPDAKKGN